MPRLHASNRCVPSSMQNERSSRRPAVASDGSQADTEDANSEVSREEFIRAMEAFRTRLSERRFSDSTDLIREDRDR